MAYKCSLCGKELNTLDEYLEHTKLCVKEQKFKEEDLQKMNADLNRVKAAKDYFEKQLADFKANYPDAYKLNFEDKKCDCNCHKEDQKPVSKTLSFEKNGDQYKLNGKDVDYEEVLRSKDPYVNAICKLLGI